MNGWFITGTDTGVGKTCVSVALMHALRARGKRVLGMKPVAAGCTATPEGLRNEDAEQLRQAASFLVPYEQVNPYAFERAVAPHIAAQRMGVSLDLDYIAATASALAAQADCLVVEGVGGWRVPLTGPLGVNDMAVRLGLPVILVVGLRLGCINHALLTAESIERSGLPLAGWVANLIEPEMEMVAENIRELSVRLPAPLLGLVPYLYGHPPEQAAPAFNLEPLLS